MQVNLTRGRLLDVDARDGAHLGAGASGWVVMPGVKPDRGPGLAPGSPHPTPPLSGASSSYM